MSRRRRPEKREILPDPKFGDQVLSKFMNNLMYDGKKAVAEGIVYTALDVVEAKAKANPVEMFHTALENIKPQVEVRSRRVGGATYQVPVEVRPERAQALAIRWLITAARGRPETRGRAACERGDAPWTPRRHRHRRCAAWPPARAGTRARWRRCGAWSRARKWPIAGKRARKACSDTRASLTRVIFSFCNCIKC